MTETDFIEPGASDLADQFIDKGYLILPAEDRDALDRIRRCAAEFAAEALGIDLPEDIADFLNGFHQHVPIDKLNAVRLAAIEGLNKQPWLRATYFKLARQAIFSIVGNELAMQRRINLSIQLPGDTSSLLPVHADVWSGDSAYEIVLWIPMVDCMRTKSMYIAPPDFDARIQENFKDFEGKTAEDLYQEIKDHVTFLDIPYGSYLLFTQNIMHGNRVNQEDTTRWSMNCRFKSVMSPYADKRLGEFFEPITLRPATRLGLDYRLPGGFQE